MNLTPRTANFDKTYARNSTISGPYNPSDASKRPHNAWLSANRIKITPTKDQQGPDNWAIFPLFTIDLLQFSICLNHSLNHVILARHSAELRSSGPTVDT